MAESQRLIESEKEFIESSIDVLDDDSVLEILYIMEPKDIISLCNIPGFVFFCRDPAVALLLMINFYPDFNPTKESWKQFKMITNRIFSKLYFSLDSKIFRSIQEQRIEKLPELTLSSIKQDYEVRLIGIPDREFYWMSGDINTSFSNIELYHDVEGALDFVFNLYIDDVMDYLDRELDEYPG